MPTSGEPFNRLSANQSKSSVRAYEITKYELRELKNKLESRI
jgi:hypothetical protein